MPREPKPCESSRELDYGKTIWCHVVADRLYGGHAGAHRAAGYIWTDSEEELANGRR